MPGDKLRRLLGFSLEIQTPMSGWLTLDQRPPPPLVLWETPGFAWLCRGGIRGLTIPGLTVPLPLPSGSRNDPPLRPKGRRGTRPPPPPVYRFALQCLAAIDEIVEGMPPGRAHLKDQLDCNRKPPPPAA